MNTRKQYSSIAKSRILETNTLVLCRLALNELCGPGQVMSARIALVCKICKMGTIIVHV